MRYYSRRWDEDRGDAFARWGASQWFFETDDDGNVLRQVEVYEAGPTLRYDAALLADQYGRLSEIPLNPNEFADFAIPADEFDRVWPATASAGRDMSLENWLRRMYRISADIVWSLWAVGYWSAERAALASDMDESDSWPNLRGIEKARDRAHYVAAMAERLGIATRSERDAWTTFTRALAITYGPHETVDLLDQASRGDIVDMIVHHSPAIPDDLGNLVLSSLTARNSPDNDEAAHHETRTQEIWRKLGSKGATGQPQ